QGASANARDKDGTSALLLAFPHLEVTKLLLERGADPNAQAPVEKYPTDMSAAGMTPLMFATWMGNVELVQLLLDKGARVNTADHKGTTALHWASVSELPNHTRVTEL